MSDEGYEKSRKKYVVGIIAVVCVALLVVSFLVLPAYASEIAETDGTVTVADTGIEGTTEEVSTVAGTDSASNIQGGVRQQPPQRIEMIL
jgi:hypothetical protein